MDSNEKKLIEEMELSHDEMRENVRKFSYYKILQYHAFARQCHVFIAKV